MKTDIEIVLARTWYIEWSCERTLVQLSLASLAIVLQVNQGLYTYGLDYNTWKGLQCIAHPSRPCPVTLVNVPSCPSKLNKYQDMLHSEKLQKFLSKKYQDILKLIILEASYQSLFVPKGITPFFPAQPMKDVWRQTADWSLKCVYKWFIIYLVMITYMNFKHL